MKICSACSEPDDTTHCRSPVDCGDVAAVIEKAVREEREANAALIRRAEAAEMHARAIAGAADRMRAHERTQDAMLREYSKRAEAAEKRVTELEAEDAIWQKHDLIAERAKLEKRVAELQALVDAAKRVIAHADSLKVASAQGGPAYFETRPIEQLRIALARELATKESK